MDLLEVVKRPPLATLRESEREGTVCYFLLQAFGTREQFCLNGRVLRIKEYPDKQQWTVVFRETDSGHNLSLSVRVNYRESDSGRAKALCVSQHIPLLWCGISLRTRGLLAAANIRYLGDLKAYTELEVCEKLHPLGVAPTRRSKRETVDLFMRLRARLRSIGFQDACNAETGPASRTTLRDSMFR